MRGQLAAIAAPLVGLTLAGAGIASEPMAVIERLYADHPYAQDPPGGAAVWYPDTAALWAGARALDFDVMTAGQDVPIAGLALSVDIEASHEARIRADLGDGVEGPVTLFFGLVRSDAGWRIIEVWREDDAGGWRLTELLAAAQ